jgi:DNA-directed RNA polymerase subunit H (RpoH/RPB5)
MSLYQIEKNANNIIDTLLINTIKMLTERGFLKKEQLDSNIKKTLSIKNDDNMYTINLDKLYGTSKQKGFLVKIISQKITGINKSYGANEFLNTYAEHPKLIIVIDIGTKVSQQIIKSFPNTEIFLQDELMINVIDHEIVPLHIPLTEVEAAEVLTAYNVTKKEMPKIFSTDPISRYYGMQPGQIFKIIRPSNRSGLCPTYRLVIKGSVA